MNIYIYNKDIFKNHHAPNCCIYIYTFMNVYIYIYNTTSSPKERSWFVNNWEFPEGMCYLGNTTLRTSPPNVPQIEGCGFYINEKTSQQMNIYNNIHMSQL